MYEETQMEKTFRKLKRLEEMLHDRMFIPVDQVEMSVAGGGIVLLVSGGLYHTGKAGRTDPFHLSEDQGL